MKHVPLLLSPLLFSGISLLVCFPVIVSSQVKIRERVELSAESKTAATLEETPYLVAPRTGRLTISPGWFVKSGSPTPSSAYLQITINDTLIHRMEVGPFFGSMTTGSPPAAKDFCTGEDVFVIHYITYSIDSFYVVQVTAGDTMRFSYYTDTNVPIGPWFNALESANYAYFDFQRFSECIWEWNYSFWYKSGLDRAVFYLSYQEAELDHFAVRFEKDTLAFTESAKIFVQAKDQDNNDIELEADRLLKLSITANDEYGTFIDKNGDTLKTTPVQLEHILYGDAKAGLIQFAAVRKNPVNPVLSKVRVELESDPTKAGERELPVVEQTLKIVMEGKREVVPRNLGGLRMPPPPTAQNRTEFRVQLTRNNVPVPNHPFQLTNDYIDGTGGHDHVTPRRDRNRDNYGYFILKRTNDITDSPYNGQTQADGRETFDFVSSLFGDRMRLRVESAQPNKKQFLWDTLSFAERVTGLQQLEEGTNYRLVGGLCEHHGPSDRGTAANCQTPNNNHWGTATLVQVVQTVTDSFAAKYPGYRLRINDMSLPSGGKFETDGSWSLAADHQEHRAGTNADVALTAYNQNGTEVTLSNRQRRRLWDLISDAAGRDPLDETNRNHYHIH
jgi:hypothetical protein